MYPVNKTCARVFYSERIQLSVSPKSFGKTVHFTNRKSRICTKTEVLYLIEEWEKNVRFASFLPKTRSILHVKNTCKRCWGIKKGFEYRDCENETQLAVNYCQCERSITRFTCVGDHKPRLSGDSFPQRLWQNPFGKLNWNSLCSHQNKSAVFTHTSHAWTTMVSHAWLLSITSDGKRLIATPKHLQNYDEISRGSTIPPKGPTFRNLMAAECHER